MEKEKLLTLKEVARYLDLSEEEVKELVEKGKIPAYKIGGSFLRFRREQIEPIRHLLKNWNPELQGLKTQNKGKQDYRYSLIERIKDFFYFNDFYIISSILILIILIIIFKAQK